MNEKEKYNEQEYLLENIQLCNGFTLKKIDLSKNINLYYASNGTSKSTIYNYLINDFKFENYEIFSHSYLSVIKNIRETNLDEVIDDINLINSDNFALKKRDLEKVAKIKNCFPTLLSNENLLSGYSEYKENFFNKFSEVSSFEQFFEDFFKIKDFFKNDNNILTNFLVNFSTAFKSFDFSKIEVSKFFNLLELIKSSKKNFSKWKENVEMSLVSIEKKMKTSLDMEKDKELQEDDNMHFSNQMKKKESDFKNKQIQENNKLKNEIISFFHMNINQPITVSSNNFVRRQFPITDWVETIVNVIKNNEIITKTFSDIIQYEIFEWIVNNIFTLNILFSLCRINSNIVGELNKFNEISKDLKSILKVVKVKGDFSQRKEIERKFNSFFFDYIKFSNIKIVDYLFFDKKIKINIFVNGKIISDFNNISDGELNALFLISMYIKMNLSSSLKKIIIMDDSSIAFDKTNWLGLLNLLQDFVNENNKIIIFSHDYSFINIAQKFLSRKKVNDNHKISIGTYQLIRENNFISFYDYEYCKDNKLNYFENFLVKNFLNLSINGERNKEIENLLHYSPISTASDLVSSLDDYFLEKEKNELLNFIEKCNIDNIIDFFEKLINCNNCSRLSEKLYKIFLVRMKIEKICVENSDSLSTSNNQKSVGTLNIIKNSNLNKEKQDELINIYNNLPSYIHLNFYDISYIFDLNIDFIDSLYKRIQSFENKLKEENNN